jgi:hypothetical protein
LTAAVPLAILLTKEATMEERILKLFVLSLLIVGLGFDCSFVPKLASTTQLQTCQSWAKAFGGSWDDVGYSVRQTRDGGYILLGYTYSFGKGRSDFWLIKTNAKGEKEWDKTFGGENDDAGYSVQQTRDGGYILVGSTYPSGSAFRDVLLIKTDAYGNNQWSKTLGGDDSEDIGYAVQQTSDDGYIMLGSTRTSEADFWLVKYCPEAS